MSWKFWLVRRVSELICLPQKTSTNCEIIKSIPHDRRTSERKNHKVSSYLRLRGHLAGKQANLNGWKFTAMKDSMLEEFGHFNPEIVQIIAYVALPIHVVCVRGSDERLLLRCCAECLRMLNVGRSIIVNLCLIGPMGESS